ncbi:RNA-binding S4 domain-containing protein [Thalassotalea euphylliae]|uniref:RNA-binding S4 domain-containing protein n=2 Tax=Thalassotalea euphylliae TaxID=1655234 RepID=A0A3E0U6F9_9GAMM|nr:RNA-binding S4 domain-containing protein [Thalassotalea euphylliae]
MQHFDPCDKMRKIFYIADKNMANVYLVEIDQQPIELYKLLKIADLVSGGGEAKVLIAEGYVLLNNEVEFQKRKKVYDGDYIQLGDNIIEVQYVAPEYEPQLVESALQENELAESEQKTSDGDEPFAYQNNEPKPHQAVTKQQASSNKKGGDKSKAPKSKATKPKSSANNKGNKKKAAKEPDQKTDKNSGKRRAISF